MKSIALQQIVDKILDFIPCAHVKATLRSVNPVFDALIKLRVSFTPFLSDYTLKTVSKLECSHRVKELLIRDLHTDMSLHQSRDFKFNFRQSGVKSLSFHPGVPSNNKEALMNFFSSIEELRFIGSTCFPLQIQFDKFHAMKKLDV